MTNLTATTNGHMRISKKTPTGASAMWRSNIILIFLMMSLGYGFFSSYAEKTFLTDTSIDGFTVQVTYINLILESGNELIDLEPLLWIHYIRTLVANFFVWVEANIGIGFSNFLIMLLFIPLLDLFSKLQRGFFVFAIPFAVAIMSPRAALAMIAVAYLVAFIINGRPYFLLSLSFFFSNLSSGTVFINLIIAVVLARNHHPKSPALYIYIILLFASFFISASEKYTGFVEQRAGYLGTVSGVGGIEALISRSTVFVSLQEGDFTKFAAYVAVAATAFLLLFMALRMREYRGYSIILLSAVSTVFVEGLGFVSLIVPILLLMAGQALPLTRPSVRSGERAIG